MRPPPTPINARPSAMSSMMRPRSSVTHSRGLSVYLAATSSSSARRVCTNLLSAAIGAPSSRDGGDDRPKRHVHADGAHGRLHDRLHDLFIGRWRVTEPHGPFGVLAPPARILAPRDRGHIGGGELREVF